jgi:hypothetical protein
MRTLLRAGLFGLSLGCLGLGAGLLFAITIEFRWLAITALACVGIGALLVLRPRMRAEEVARRLDRRFRLHEQFTTALEVGAQPEGVAVHLQDQARLNLGRIRRHIAANRSLPWIEAGMFVALLCVFLGLAVFSGVVAPPSFGTAEPLPAPIPPALADQRFPPEPFQPPGELGSETVAVPGPEAAAALAAIADALRDQSITRPAAEALDQGNPFAAAQGLRAIADQAGQLSTEARSSLAESLRNAADQLEASRPDLAEQLRDSANNLASGNDQAAANALEQLADTVDQLGQSDGDTSATASAPEGQAGSAAQAAEPGQAPGSAGAGQSLPGEQREQPTRRLGVDGVPLELSGEGDGNTPTSGASDRPADGISNRPDFERGSGALSDDTVAAGDDPLRIPADLRDVVQDYFSP